MLIYNTKFFIQFLHEIVTWTANNLLNPQLIPEFSNILSVNACDITVKIIFKITFQKTHNYYKDNDGMQTNCKLQERHFFPDSTVTINYIHIIVAVHISISINYFVGYSNLQSKSWQDYLHKIQLSKTLFSRKAWNALFVWRLT